MKTILKNTMFAAALVAGLSLTSCKDKNEEGSAAGETETVDSTAGMSSEPIGDTIVRENDTIVKTGTENDTKENATGTQVP
jgi:hypothetical protein